MRNAEIERKKKLIRSTQLEPELAQKLREFYFLDPDDEIPQELRIAHMLRGVANKVRAEANELWQKRKEKELSMDQRLQLPAKIDYLLKQANNIENQEARQLELEASRIIEIRRQEVPHTLVAGGIAGTAGIGTSTAATGTGKTNLSDTDF